MERNEEPVFFDFQSEFVRLRTCLSDEIAKMTDSECKRTQSLANSNEPKTQQHQTPSVNLKRRISL